MAKFTAIASSPARAGKSRSRRLRNILILLSLAFVLACNSPSFAQRVGREEPPPRPQSKTNPWPWFLAFILLGAAWYPAFKNSKREMER